MELRVSKSQLVSFDSERLIFQKFLLLGHRQEVKRLHGKYARGRVELNPRLLQDVIVTKHELVIKFI